MFGSTHYYILESTIIGFEYSTGNWKSKRNNKICRTPTKENNRPQKIYNKTVKLVKETRDAYQNQTKYKNQEKERIEHK